MEEKRRIDTDEHAEKMVSFTNAVKMQVAERCAWVRRKGFSKPDGDAPGHSPRTDAGQEKVAA